jgi:hypothetical protein
VRRKSTTHPAADERPAAVSDSETSGEAPDAERSASGEEVRSGKEE